MEISREGEQKLRQARLWSNGLEAVIRNPVSLVQTPESRILRYENDWAFQQGSLKEGFIAQAGGHASSATHPVLTLTTVLLASSTTLILELSPSYPHSLSSIHLSHILRVPPLSWYRAPNKGFKDEEKGFLHLKDTGREQMGIWRTKETR